MTSSPSQPPPPPPKRKPWVSCAECRRLRVRCDRKFPCGPCRRRGCASICPDGTTTHGSADGPFRDPTIELRENLTKLAERIRALENALSGVIPEHPLLSKDQRALKTRYLRRKAAKERAAANKAEEASVSRRSSVSTVEESGSDDSAAQQNYMQANIPFEIGLANMQSHSTHIHGNLLASQDFASINIHPQLPYIDNWSSPETVSTSTSSNGSPHSFGRIHLPEPGNVSAPRHDVKNSSVPASHLSTLSSSGEPTGQLLGQSSMPPALSPFHSGQMASAYTVPVYPQHPPTDFAFSPFDPNRLGPNQAPHESTLSSALEFDQTFQGPLVDLDMSIDWSQIFPNAGNQF